MARKTAAPHPAVVARFAVEHGLTVRQVTKLCKASDAVGAAGASATGDPAFETADQVAQTRFHKLALASGFDGYEMYGLYPTLRKAGRDIYLPE